MVGFPVIFVISPGVGDTILSTETTSTGLVGEGGGLYCFWYFFRQGRFVDLSELYAKNSGSGMSLRRQRITTCSAIFFRRRKDIYP